jgi:hypothetical protein
MLNFSSGACIFLGSDRLCRLHKAYGAESKPLPCRLFPYRAVRTETGTRLTVSPRCFEAHRSYQSQAAQRSPQELLSEWQVWRLPAVVRGRIRPSRSLPPSVDVIAPTKRRSGSALSRQRPMTTRAAAGRRLAVWADRPVRPR